MSLIALQSSSKWLAVSKKPYEIGRHELEVRADDFRDLNPLGARGDVTLRIGELILRRQNKEFRSNVQEGIVRRPPIHPQLRKVNHKQT